MTRIILPLVWAVMAVTVLGGVHYYLWARLVRDTAPPPLWRVVGLALLITMALLIPAAFALGRILPSGLAGPFVWGGYIWMGVMFYLLLVIFLGDLGRLISHGINLATSAEITPERRLFLSRLVAGAAAGTAVLAGGAALRGGLVTPAVKRVRVALGRLPEQLSGTIIVQLTDLHIGPTLGRRFIEEVVEQTNALHPDVVAITGDLVDGSVADLGDRVAPLADLEARHGVFFVTGNHEYYSGVTSWIAELERLGIRVLRNERVAIGDGEVSFDLGGVDDASAGMFGGGHGMDVGRACLDRDAGREMVLLAHQPKAIGAASKNDVGLVIAGHTHGGQIWPFTYLVGLTQPYMSGLHRHGDRTQIYVSRGTGYWGPPMRLGAPAEVTRIELVRA